MNWECTVEGNSWTMKMIMWYGARFRWEAIVDLPLSLSLVAGVKATKQRGEREKMAGTSVSMRDSSGQMTERPDAEFLCFWLFHPFFSPFYSFTANYLEKSTLT